MKHLQICDSVPEEILGQKIQGERHGEVLRESRPSKPVDVFPDVIGHVEECLDYLGIKLATRP
jgi:hypothetical protein